MKNTFFLIIGLIIIFGSMFLFFQESLLGTNQTKIIKINSVSVIAEVADTLEKRAKGLSERKIFPEGTGMLFIFDNPAQYGFWMKNMNFPIDIVWINEEWQIVGIEKQVSPETFPQIFYPNQVVKYVLELPAGFSDKYRIDIGQYVTI